MSDAVAFACFRMLFVAHNKRMKELLHEHIVTLFNLNYGVEVGKTGKQENGKSQRCRSSMDSGAALQAAYARKNLLTV